MIYFCVGYLLFIITIWLIYYLRWRIYPPIIKDDDIFSQIKKYHQIIKIKNNVYYFRGVYITPDYMYYLDFKIQHFKNLFFIQQFLKSI